MRFLKELVSIVKGKHLDEASDLLKELSDNNVFKERNVREKELCKLQGSGSVYLSSGKILDENYIQQVANRQISFI
jgi:hypothetical protein